MVNDSWPSVLRSLEISSLCAKRNCTKEVKLHVDNINADCNFIPPQWVKMSNSSVDPGRPLIAGVGLTGATKTPPASMYVVDISILLLPTLLYSVLSQFQSKLKANQQI
ncbi:hypothetical protein PCH_Pc20g04980 [Penicillium rubens Wisconsin 54-1255]|uniref:Uncharacterized protein n=1 Tax=Penicillium rubens (strain ATCC 28089 / DSM 1075 / NRRL 1951 / Wisconsin 54-1255) TaxID=500485 RepID=B6HEC2_PENRW|nr:hypothetical protein PCH_Pc20g04980 [Penicillium rubens Wisconsin 54-1255]